MNKDELYKLALSDVHKYNLLNEIFAIRDTRVEKEDYTIAVNGFISLDVLNQYIKLQEKLDKINKYFNYKIENEKYCYLADNPKDRNRKDVFEEIQKDIQKIINEEE